MDDFRMPYDWRKSIFWPEICAAEVLEDGGIRSCIVGDFAASYYGGDIYPSDVHIAIADEQLKAARCMLLEKAFIEVPQIDRRFNCPYATTESTMGWPGYKFVVSPNSSPLFHGVVIVTASIWHLDLQPNSWQANTFLHTDTRCRIPTRLFYIRALIDAITSRYPDQTCNDRVTDFIKYNYLTLSIVLPQNILDRLSDEDKFWRKYFWKVLFPAVREEVCKQRERIQKRMITIEAAEKSIPRPDLKIAAIKKRYKDHASQQAQDQASKTPIMVE